MLYGSWDYHKGVSYDKELQKTESVRSRFLGVITKEYETTKSRKKQKVCVMVLGIITKETQATKSRKEAQTIFDNIFNYYKTTFRLWNTSLF